MVTKRSAIIAIVAALFPIQEIASVCFNDDSFSIFYDNKSRSCRNIRFNEDRRYNMCREFEDVQNACPQACGSCCEDDTTFTFRRNGEDEDGDCEWLAEGDEDRKAFYCDATKTSNGRTIRDGCPVACDFCQERVELKESVTRGGSCEDDEDYVLTLDNGEDKNCAWIVQNTLRFADRRQRYCNREVNGRAVGAACPVSCGLCTPTLTPAPAHCVDEPGWRFHFEPEMGCINLAPDPDFFCTKIGNANWTHKGKTVYDACCVCGEGTGRKI